MSFPPTMSTVGRLIASRATRQASTFVALESLIHSTPSFSSTFSRRCSTPGKSLRHCANIFSLFSCSATDRSILPIAAHTAAFAAIMLRWLCLPGSGKSLFGSMSLSENGHRVGFPITATCDDGVGFGAYPSIRFCNSLFIYSSSLQYTKVSLGVWFCMMRIFEST